MAGRPSKFNATLSAKMISLYEKGYTDIQVARTIGISVRTVHYWKIKNSEFLHSVREAKELVDEMVQFSLLRRALGFSYKAEEAFCYKGKIIRALVRKYSIPDVKACIFWLRNRQPGNWR